MAEFFHMDGYAVFVWSAYGITALVLTASVLFPLIRHKQVHQRITRLLEEEQD
ncbi:MAG: heme exporter protein CcmD [Thioalkalispiraceae bacterium]|jgi:heme exporter protein D